MLSGGSADTGCTINGANGNLTCSGALAGSNVSGTNTGDQNVFTTIAVSGQSNVVSDATSDTLTFIAGTGVTLTTNASTDEITIAATGTGGDITAVGDITTGDAFTNLSGGTSNGNSLYFEGSTADGNDIQLTAADPGADFVLTLPALTGTITALGNTTTGSGSTLVLATSPTLVTPVLGVATATSINKVAITAPATGSTLTIADGKTLTASDSTTLATNSITFAGTEALTLAAAKNVTFADAFATSGAFSMTLTATGTTNVTLPTSGTLCSTSTCEDAITFDNGLTRTADNVQLGGNLTGNTTITQDSAETFNIVNSGTGETSFNLSSTGDLNIKDNGTTFFTFQDDGTALYTGGTGVTSQTAFGLTANSLTTGTLLGLTSTSLTTGSFLDINNGSSIFNVSNSSFTTSLPVNFTSPGDVSIANDIQFTNPTQSLIKSYAGLTIQPGDTFSSANLTLRPYNEGSIYVDSSVAPVVVLLAKSI